MQLGSEVKIPSKHAGRRKNDSSFGQRGAKVAARQLLSISSWVEPLIAMGDMYKISDTHHSISREMIISRLRQLYGAFVSNQN